MKIAGVGQQPFDLVDEFDVAAGMRVERGAQTVTAGDRGDTIDDREHRRPTLVGQARPRRTARRWRRVRRRGGR